MPHSNVFAKTYGTVNSITPQSATSARKDYVRCVMKLWNTSLTENRSPQMSSLNWKCQFWKKRNITNVTGKSVFGVCDQVKLKPACSETQASWSLEISITSRGIILSKQRTTKALNRLRGCAVWSALLLFAYSINRFSHDVADIVLAENTCTYNSYSFWFSFRISLHMNLNRTTASWWFAY